MKYAHFLLSLLLIISCVNSDNDSPKIKGYTETNNMGKITGNIDKDDWVMRDTATDTIIIGDSLFSFPLKGGVYPAYPNSTKGVVAFRFSLKYRTSPIRTNAHIYILNSNLQKIKTLLNGKMEAGHRFIHWNLRTSEDQKVMNGLYRLVIITDQWKSYGDIKVEN